jgi:Concanavalin A-like lectin/glucanases superfamily
MGMMPCDRDSPKTTKQIEKAAVGVNSGSGPLFFIVGPYFVLCVVAYSLSPFDPIWEGTWDRLVRALTMSRSAIGSVREVPVHFAVFALLGIIASVGGRGRERMNRLMMVGVFAFAIEVLQVGLVRRHPHVIDLLTHVAGVLSGSWVTGRFRRAFDVFVAWTKRGRVRWGVALSSMGFVWLVGVLVYPAVSMTSLDDWETVFDLYVGDEVTRNRAWLGDLRSVEIYDRAISEDSVEACRRGALSRDGLVWSYDYSAEYAARDGNEPRSGMVRPRPVVLNGGAMSRADVDSGGLHIREPTLIWHRENVEAETRRIMGTGEMSVSAWVRCANDLQDGPARIVTLSSNASVRNFTLGQEAMGFAFRIRSGITGRNGSRPELISAAAVEPGVWQHVLATYRNGISRLYVDGVERGWVDHRDVWYVLRLGGNRVSKAVGSVLAVGLSVGVMVIVLAGYSRWRRIVFTAGVVGLVIAAGLMMQGFVSGESVHWAAVWWLAAGVGVCIFLYECLIEIRGRPFAEV